jgi:hypothetical protein
LLSVSFFRFQTVVRQHQALIVRTHSHAAVEQVAAREVKHCEGVLVKGIMFDVNAMMLSFEEADAHIARVVVAVEGTWLGEAFSDNLFAC